MTQPGSWFRVSNMGRRRAEDADASWGEPPSALPGLRSGELARRAGVSKDTLRFYERKGLLEPPRRTSNNYRLFPTEAVERLRWIRHALAMGFTVEELARVAGARSRGQFPCREVRSRRRQAGGHRATAAADWIQRHPSPQVDRPRTPSKPSLTMIGSMRRAAIGSAHHQPMAALRMSPPSRIAER